MNRKMILFFATGGGVGYLPGAPGTYGTIVALLLYWAVAGLAPLHFFLFTLVFSLFAIWVASLAESFLGNHDSEKIVIDEIAGYLVTVLFLPFQWKYAITAFVVFRVFDILKPWPIRQIDQKCSGGWGVVADDLLAGLFGCGVMQVAVRLIALF